MEISLWRRHAPMVRNGAFSHKIDYIKKKLGAFKSPIGQSGEASRWRVCYQRGLPRLVSLDLVAPMITNLPLASPFKSNHHISH